MKWVLVEHLTDKHEQMLGICFRKMVGHNEIYFAVVDCEIIIERTDRVFKGTDMKEHHAKRKHIGLRKINFSSKLNFIINKFT